MNDGEEDSEISFVQIRVLGDLKVWLHITPGRFSLKKPPRVLLASIRFPKGIQKSQIETSMPLRLMPLNLLSAKMKLHSSPNHAWIEASFKPTKEQISSLARGKEVPMTVTGKLKSGRKFSGVDKVFVK